MRIRVKKDGKRPSNRARAYTPFHLKPYRISQATPSHASYVKRFCHICVTRRKADITTLRQRSTESKREDWRNQRFRKALATPLRDLVHVTVRPADQHVHGTNEVCDGVVLGVVIVKVTTGGA